MGLITKLEKIFNDFIYRLAEFLLRLGTKFVPKKVVSFYATVKHWFIKAMHWLQSLPRHFKEMGIKILGGLKSFLATFDFRAKLKESYASATQYSKKSIKVPSKFRTFYMAPFLLLSQWLQGLTTGQSVILLAFTAASVLAGINIIFSGHRMVSTQNTTVRAPASAEEDELKFDRPDYYKKNVRHFNLTNFRLPVYIGEVNQLKSIDIDFNATLSNREAKKFLEKHEFHLRDHLILRIELLIATFPLEDEGKVVIKEKLWSEINQFLIDNNVEGHLEDLKITYILAN